MHAYTYMDLDIKGLLFITKIGMGRYIFVELCNIKFHENLLSCSQFVRFRQAGRQAGRQADRQRDMVKITGTLQTHTKKKRLTLLNQNTKYSTPLTPKASN
jgi:hypothetical protein